MKASEVQRERCGATTVFWPRVEACEAECFLAPHEGTVHEDEILGEWDEDDMATQHPEVER